MFFVPNVINIQEVDGDPNGKYTTIIFPNGTLTDNGNGSVTYTPIGGGGSGDVVGPSSATDNAIVRYDTTTGKLVQNSGVTIDDSDNLAGVNNVTGSDTNFVTGTAGVDGNIVTWNADGDAVDGGIAVADILVSSDIGTSVQAYDADTAKYDDAIANFTGTLQSGGSDVVVSSDIGSSVQAFNANLSSLAGLTPASSLIRGNGLGGYETVTQANFITDNSITTNSNTQTLTNKTFDANGTGNSLSNIEVEDMAATAIVTEADGIGSNDNDTSLPTSAAVKDYADNIIVAPIMTSWMTPYIIGATASIVADNNTSLHCRWFNLPAKIIVNHISFYISSITTPGTLLVAIFSEDGSTRLINVTTGTISASGVITIDVSAVTLAAGNYWLTILSNDTADLSIRGLTLPTGITDILVDTTNGPSLTGELTVTASTMPSTLNVSGIIGDASDDLIPFRLDN